MQWGLLAQAADSGTNWTELLITALGASLVGGVLGGTLTTWLRGRIEREEAWRTRLIEAADDFMKLSSKAGLQGGACLHRFQDPAEDMMHDDGTVTDAGPAALQLARDANTEARIGSLRIGLLFGPSSDARRAANLLVGSLRSSLNTLEGVPLGVPVLPDSGVERVALAQHFLSEFEDALPTFMEAVHRRLGYAEK
jgi:hypothetical protein